LTNRSITSSGKLGLDCSLFRKDFSLFIKASDYNLSWLCEFLKEFFNLFRAENGRSSAALVTGIINNSSHTLKICGKMHVNHTLSFAISGPENSTKSSLFKATEKNTIILF
jgi:hypothetical protein